MKQLPFNWKYDILPGAALFVLLMIPLAWPGENQWIDPELLHETLSPGMTKQECAAAIGLELEGLCSIDEGRGDRESCWISGIKSTFNLFDPQNSTLLIFEEGRLVDVHVETRAGFGKTYYSFSDGPWAVMGKVDPVTGKAGGAR